MLGLELRKRLETDVESGRTVELGEIRNEKFW